MDWGQRISEILPKLLIWLVSIAKTCFLYLKSITEVKYKALDQLKLDHEALIGNPYFKT